MGPEGHDLGNTCTSMAVTYPQLSAPAAFSKKLGISLAQGHTLIKEVNLYDDKAS